MHFLDFHGAAGGGCVTDGSLVVSKITRKLTKAF